MIDYFRKYFNEEERQVLSPDQLRLLVGIVGICFPMILIMSSMMVGDCKVVLPSMSHYYYSGSRDIFVGILFAIAFILFGYTGYDSKDNIAGKLACLFALGIALFPTESCAELEQCFACMTSINQELFNPLSSKIHYISAILFFLTLIYFSMFLFTKSDSDPCDWKRPKRMRNIIYKICGWIMIVSIALAGFFLYSNIGVHPIDCENNPPSSNLFWFEMVALEAFGISWLTKAELFFPDEK